MREPYNAEKKQTAYKDVTFRVVCGRLVPLIVTIFCTSRDLADVINCTKLMFVTVGLSFGHTKGQSLGSSIVGLNRDGPYHCVLH